METHVSIKTRQGSLFHGYEQLFKAKPKKAAAQRSCVAWDDDDNDDDNNDDDDDDDDDDSVNDDNNNDDDSNDADVDEALFAWEMWKKLTSSNLIMSPRIVYLS